MAVITRGLTRNGDARFFVINSKDIVNRAIEIHKPTATATAALGRVLTAASMMGCMLKNKGNSITVNFKCDGSAGGILAVADYMGNVKGYINNPSADAERKKNGKLNVSGIVGGGTLIVVKDEGQEQPYVGITKIVSGEIAEDIVSYFAESEQTPTLSSLGVLVENGTCRAAGGIIIQLMPGAEEETVSVLEKNSPLISNISKLFDDGMSSSDIVKLAFGDIETDIYDEIDVGYVCDCSSERMLGALASLKPSELEETFDENGTVSVECQFCNKKRVFTREQVSDYKSKIGKQGR